MSKYLIWLIVFAVASVLGFIWFPANVGTLGPALLVWLPVFGFTCALGGVQWKVYNDAKHPGKVDALYARFLGMPMEEFNALTGDAKAQVKEAVDRIRAQAARATGG